MTDDRPPLTPRGLATAIGLGKSWLYVLQAKMLAAESSGRPLPLRPDGRTLIPWPPDINPTTRRKTYRMSLVEFWMRGA